MRKLFSMHKRLIGLGLAGAFIVGLAVLGALWGLGQTASAQPPPTPAVGLVHVNPDGSDYTGNPYCPDTKWVDGKPTVNPAHDCNNITSQNHVIRTEGFDWDWMWPVSWNIENLSGATATIVAGWTPTSFSTCAGIPEVHNKPNWDHDNDGEMCIVIHSSTPGETRVTFTYQALGEYFTPPVVKEWDSLVDSVILKNGKLKHGDLDLVKVYYDVNGDTVVTSSEYKTLYLPRDEDNDGKRDTDDEHLLDKQSTWQDHTVIVDETHKRIKVPVPIHIIEVVHGEHPVLIDAETITTHQPTEGAVVEAVIESDRGCTFFTDEKGTLDPPGYGTVMEGVSDGLGRFEVWVDTNCEEQAKIIFRVGYPGMPGSWREELEEWVGINWVTIELAKQPQIRWAGEEIVLQKRWALPDEWYPNTMKVDTTIVPQPVCPLATGNVLYEGLWCIGPEICVWWSATNHYVNWVRKDPSPGALQGAYIDSNGDWVLDSLAFMGASEARGDIDEQCISKALADSETPGQMDVEAKLIESTWVCEEDEMFIDDDDDSDPPFAYCVDEDPIDGLDNDQGECAYDWLGDPLAPEFGPECDNAVDDDYDGYVNDGCDPVSYTGESSCDDALDDGDDSGLGRDESDISPGACINEVDDDYDGVVNDGCDPVSDGYVNDGCDEAGGEPESNIAGACDNDIDDDNDSWVNDGCPQRGNVPETGTDCGNATDDEYDDWWGRDETDMGADACTNDVDDDYDGVVNDGCPPVGDGYVNDGCPSIGDGYIDEDPPNPVGISWDPEDRKFICEYPRFPFVEGAVIADDVQADLFVPWFEWVYVDDAYLWKDELINKHPFLVWFIKMYQVKLTNVEGERKDHNAGKWDPADPWDNSTDVTEESRNVSADALVRVRVKGWLRTSDPSGRPDVCIDMNGNGNGLTGEDATPPGEPYPAISHEGCPDRADELLPGGYWVLPDDLVDDEDDPDDGSLAGADAINTRPNWDVMQDPDGPNGDSKDYIGPKSTLDSHEPVGEKPVTRLWLGRKTVFPDGKVNDHDAIMPPLKIRASIDEGDAGFLKAADKKDDVYTGGKNLYYRILIPSDPEIPAFIQDGGYDWSSDDFPPPADDDVDGVPNDKDNCPRDWNADQSDQDGDKLGDECDDDADDDTILNAGDNCWLNANADQKDTDTDGIGDVCDSTPTTPGGFRDSDKDGVEDDDDNCPTVKNGVEEAEKPAGNQTDSDDDGVGDACDYNKALPWWVRPPVPYEFWTIINKKEREDENETNPVLARRPSYIEFYTDNRGEGMFFVNGDFNLSYDECRTDPMSLAPDCRPGDVVGESTITVIGDLPYTRGKQGAMQSNPVIKTWEWGGYKKVAAVRVDPTHILIIAHLKDRDGFCKYEVKDDPTKKDGVQFSPSLHEVQHEWIEFLINTGVGSILVPESTGVSPNALLVGDDPTLDPHVHTPLAKTRATGLEDGVIVNPRHAMARAEDVRILDYYEKARGVAEGKVEDDACEAWVLIQHPIDEEPDVSVIFNDPEGVITRHWPPTTREFRLVGGPSADQKPPLWNDSCYIGPNADITEAMADILCPDGLQATVGEDGELACDDTGPVQVLAVYRYKEDQTWDTWFPEDPAGEAEPPLSTMTELSPYDQLWILMSDNVYWEQEVTTDPKAEQVDLVENWNSICYAGDSKAPADATTSIANDIQVIYTYTLDQKWLRYVPGRTDLTNMTTLNEYTSVWVLVTTAAGTTWRFDP